MTDRLGRALVQYIGNQPGAQKFVLLEDIPSALAEAVTTAWDDAVAGGRVLPELAVLCGVTPNSFGGHLLQHDSGTNLRNRAGPHGICLVVCEGQQVPDRQSLRAFKTIAPADLLRNVDELTLLAQQDPAIEMDGPARAVRQALTGLDQGELPAAAAVARYFDELAAGADPMEALPRIGGFRDRVPHTGPDSKRVIENLRLAARRRSDEVLSPGELAEVRRRAERLFIRRSDGNPMEKAEHLMGLLRSGSDEVLRYLSFDEARDILDQRHLDLTQQVRQEIVDYRFAEEERDRTAANSIEWDYYLAQADLLKQLDQRREAARSLLEFDDSQLHQVFQRPTRRKLEGIARGRQIRALGSCPEAALVQAIGALPGRLAQIQLTDPTPAATVDSPSSARDLLAVVLARFRVGALMRHLQEKEGIEVDGMLLHEPDADLSDDLFTDGELEGVEDLPTISLRLRSEDEEGSILVQWTPDLDDLALLRATHAFASDLGITIRVDESASTSSLFSADPVVEQVRQPLERLANQLQEAAARSLRTGLTGATLRNWSTHWREEVDRSAPSGQMAFEDLSAAGSILGNDESICLGPWSPLKAEWLADYLDTLNALVLRAVDVRKNDVDTDEPLENTAAAIQGLSAAQYPPFLRLPNRARPILPTNESRLWSAFGGAPPDAKDRFAEAALASVVDKLLTVQPEAARHFRCMAWGPGAADLMLREAIALAGKRVGEATVEHVEVFCIGERPSDSTLAAADEAAQRETEPTVHLRYLPDLRAAKRWLQLPSGLPGAHLALVTGLSAGGQRLSISPVDMQLPPRDEEILFAPRTSLRARSGGRVLLLPPGVTQTHAAWLRLMTAIDSRSWPSENDDIVAPELRLDSADLKDDLLLAHGLARWVATLDPYVTRDSLDATLDHKVAILHQERRLSGESPLALVISEAAGGPTDQAVGRSLKNAKLIKESANPTEIGRHLREVAAQGYGILALEAATTGTGINELVGHVVAFSLLGTHTTPWPLPPGCRVLLVNLDDYRRWFPSGRRADLLALAIDTEEQGVHVACIEVKARRTDMEETIQKAADQIRQTLSATRYAAYPEAHSPHSRLWLNRIVDAAYAVARESGFRLTSDELQALEAFRRGTGTLEWAGVGLLFGPNIEPLERYIQHPVQRDRIPILLRSVPLTQQVLSEAASVRLNELRTVESNRPAIEGGRLRRRPETGVPRPVRQAGEVGAVEPEAPSGNGAGRVVAVNAPKRGDGPKPAAGPTNQHEPKPPLIGWDFTSDEEVHWNVWGPGAIVNGHIEIWGSSGSGKTMFVKCLLAQLAAENGTHFGIADFKNDYGDDFPSRVGARFIDLWNTGAPFNPLALTSTDPKDVSKAIIEFRDTVAVAARSFTRLGHRQQNRLQQALEQAYDIGEREKRWPTLRTLDSLLDDELQAVIGDLTKHPLFREGPPLGDVIDENVVFGLRQIPGNGLTTVLSAGFILASILTRIQTLPTVANRVDYVMVVDEAHRVASFRAIDTMVREGRSTGLAVWLATQQPGDLPDVVSTNAQTKVCFRLPDGTVANAAAKRLDPADPSLAENIRSLGTGEAYVSIAGGRPKLLKVVQFWRDAAGLTGQPDLES